MLLAGAALGCLLVIAGAPAQQRDRATGRDEAHLSRAHKSVVPAPDPGSGAFTGATALDMHI